MSRKLRRNTRRALVATLLGLTVGGGVLASAASLGVTGNTLGAGTVVIASCDTDGVTLNYTNAYTPASGVYRTSAVTIGGLNAACNGKRLDITLKDATGASLGTGSITALSLTVGPPAVTTANVTLGTTADASAVVGAAVVISD